MSVVQNVKIFKNKPFKLQTGRRAPGAPALDLPLMPSINENCAPLHWKMLSKTIEKNDRCNVTFLTVYLHLNIVKTFLFHPNCSLTERVNHNLTTHISPRKLLLLRAI